MEGKILCDLSKCNACFGPWNIEKQIAFANFLYPMVFVGIRIKIPENIFFEMSRT